MAPAKYLTTAGLKTESTYDIQHGTSFSAALVAGVVSQFLGSRSGTLQNPAKSVENFLLESSLRDSLNLPEKLKSYWPNRLLRTPFKLSGCDIPLNWENEVGVFSFA